MLELESIEIYFIIKIYLKYYLIQTYSKFIK